MLVAGGSTNVITYFAMRQSSGASAGQAATGLTITDFDLQYVRSGAAPSVKVDATALAATDSAWDDNKAIEIDVTDQPGLYRVDWPNAAFAAGVREVILSVKVATAFTEHLRVEIDAEVTTEALGTQAKADVNAEVDAAIETYKLDHLVATADGDDPVDGSIMAHLVSATEDWSTFVPSTDSLQAIRDRGDSSWITATGFSTHDPAAVWDRIISMANHNIGQSAGKILRQTGDLMQIDGAVSDVSPTTTNFDTNLTQVDGYFDDAVMVFSNGAANAGIGKPVSAYVNANGNMTFVAELAWPVTPVDGDDFVIIALHSHPISEVADGVWAKTMTELAAVPGVTGTTLAALEWLFQLARNKGTQTSTTKTLRNDADDGNIATSEISSDGTTFTREEWS